MTEDSLRMKTGVLLDPILSLDDGGHVRVLHELAPTYIPTQRIVKGKCGPLIFH